MNLDTLYPVGAVIYAMANIQPDALYGGTWNRIKGKCLVFVDENDGDFNAALKAGGAKAQGVTAAQIPAHAHGYTGSAIGSSSAGAHTHNVISDATAGGGTTYNLNAAGGWLGGFLDSQSHYHTLAFGGTVGNTGSGTAHENRQPYLTCYLWYRAA